MYDKKHTTHVVAQTHTRGHLLLTASEETFQPPARYRTLERAFARGSGHGLLELGAHEVGSTLPGDVAYWRDFAAKFVTTICTQPEIDRNNHSLPPPSTADLEQFVAAAPMDGGVYVTDATAELHHDPRVVEVVESAAVVSGTMNHA